MPNKFILAALAAAVTLPTLAAAPMASAQPYDPACVRSNQASTGEGVALGAIGGALIGNALGGRHSRGTDTALGAVAGGVAGGAIANGRNDPCPEGYYRPAPPPGYGPPPPAYPAGGGFWAGAPTRIYDRIAFLQSRIDRGASNGRIAPDAARYAYHDLNDIRRQEADMRYRDGGHLSPPDRDYLQSRLDNLSQRLHWDARWGY